MANKRKIKLTRRKLEKMPRESIHEARNWSKADVAVSQWPPESGNRVVIKDLRQRPLWFRVLAGRYLLWREWRSLCALRDIDGVPKPIARPSADVIVMEHKSGRPIENLLPEQMPAGAVEQIETLVRKMHSRGVTHGDLHGFNILVDDNGAVALIDWATACVFGADLRGTKKFAFEEWKALDERALAKVKIMHTPERITERERDLLLHGGSRIYRFLKKFKYSAERLRGMDEKRLAQRAAKQKKYLQQLELHFKPGHEPAQSTLGETRET